jgi:hypothetical protein
VKYLLPIVLGILSLAVNPLPADDVTLADRLGQLESETQALRAELKWLREHPVRLPRVEATPVSTSAPAATGEDYYTFERPRSARCWTKGDFTITPYGFLWGNMVYETERSNDNVIYAVTKQFKLGFEVSQWKTLYKAETPGESTRLEFMGRYGF